MGIEDSRRKILESGLELARNAHVMVTLPVRLQDAARAAGLTTGAAYKVWDTQTEFQQDLGRYVLGEVGRNTVDRLEAAADALIAVGAPLSEFIRVLSKVDFESFRDDKDIRLNYVLTGAAALDPNLATAARGIYAEQQGQLSQMYELLLAFHGRRMRPEYRLEDLVSVLSVTADGFLLQTMFMGETLDRTISRPTGPGGEGREWHLFACVVQAIVEGFTEPATS